jgi:hypothetical protein
MNDQVAARVFPDVVAETKRHSHPKINEKESHALIDNVISEALLFHLPMTRRST